MLQPMTICILLVAVRTLVGVDVSVDPLINVPKLRLAKPTSARNRVPL